MYPNLLFPTSFSHLSLLQTFFLNNKLLVLSYTDYTEWKASHFHDCALWFLYLEEQSIFFVPHIFELPSPHTFNWLSFNHPLRLNLIISISRKCPLNSLLFSASCIYWLPLHYFIIIMSKWFLSYWGVLKGTTFINPCNFQNLSSTVPGNMADTQWNDWNKLFHASHPYSLPLLQGWFSQFEYKKVRQTE